MNSMLPLLRRLRYRRFFWSTVFGVLICSAALMFVVYDRAALPEWQTAWLNRMALYGVCPECHIPIDTTVELHLTGRWDARIENRISSYGRVLIGRAVSGRYGIFECPNCGATLCASVEFYGKQTRALPYGKHIHVWAIETTQAGDTRQAIASNIWNSSLSKTTNASSVPAGLIDTEDNNFVHGDAERHGD